MIHAEAAQALVNALEPYGATSAKDNGDGTATVSFLLTGDPNGTAWRKGVQVALAGTTPQAVLHLMNEWKRDTLLSLDFAHPSDTIKYAVQAFGREAVKEALRQWPIH